MNIKIRGEVRGNHIRTKIFIGEDAEHLQLAGVLMLRVGEWQLFNVALSMGASNMEGHLVVECPDDKKVLSDLGESDA